MNGRRSGTSCWWVATICLLVVLARAAVAQERPAESGDARNAAVKRGAYLTFAGGCVPCHTDIKNKGPLLAGGGPLKTPFGTFYAPNITPDPEHGIGSWTDADFIRAMRRGIRPDGAKYFPVFPYTSFTRIEERDLVDMKAYLSSLKPVDRPSRRHEIRFPFGWRFAQTFWKWLYFREGPVEKDASRSDGWNRGAYLVNALAHCGECHTPRSSLGGLDRNNWLAGTSDGPEGEAVPNITPDTETGIGKWSRDDIATYLKSGLDPDGDFAGSLMADVIEHGTSNLTDADVRAIAEYLRSLPPIRNKVGKKR